MVFSTLPCEIILGKGDEVLIVSPYWLSYPEMVKLAGAKPVILNTSIENGFKVKPEDIRSALTKNTRAIIINSPSNPLFRKYQSQKT